MMPGVNSHSWCLLQGWWAKVEICFGNSTVTWLLINWQSRSLQHPYHKQNSTLEAIYIWSGCFCRPDERSIFPDLFAICVILALIPWLRDGIGKEAEKKLQLLPICQYLFDTMIKEKNDWRNFQAHSQGHQAVWISSWSHRMQINQWVTLTSNTLDGI